MSTIFLGNPHNHIKNVILNPKITKPLTFVAESNNAKLSFNKYNNPDEIFIEYSVNDSKWQDYQFNTQFTANIGDKICFRAKNENPTISKNSSNYYTFSITNKFAVSGNLQTLLKSDGSRFDAPSYCYYNMFSFCNCTTAPDLFATQLSNQCYRRMFYRCTNLKVAPGLPAKQLADYCYNNMFSGCTQLEVAPLLPAMQLTKSCYSGMFTDCESLKTAPALPSMQLAEYCYSAMFSGCTSLEAAPDLPATTLANYCYQQMFEYCESLVKAPATLPALKLTWSCYENMFAGCTSLEVAPHLPDAEYRSIGSCYYNMFFDCYNLSCIDVDFEMWEYNSTVNWLTNAGRDVEGDKIFICYDELTHGENDFTSERIPNGWKVQIKEHPKTIEEFIYTDEELQTPLTFTNKRSGFSNTIKLIKYGNPDSINLLYSTDGESWNEYEIGNPISMPNFNDKVMFKASPEGNPRISNGWSNYYMFVIGSRYNVSASGNVQTLLDATGKRLDVPVFCFYRLFYRCEYLTDAPMLPAKNLSEQCYTLMFSDTHIKTAPKLPAKKLAKYCYSSMFSQCPYLINPPILRAKRLADGCYSNMFDQCSSLKKSPKLPAIDLAPECYQYMFCDCAELINAPALPAVQLVDRCYKEMFSGCGMLKRLEVNFTDWNPTGIDNPTENWVLYAGTSSQQPYPTNQLLFICPSSLKHDESCFNDNMIPPGWTIVQK